MNKLLIILAIISLTTFACVEQSYADSTSYINVNTGVAKVYNLPTGAWSGSFNAGYSFNRGFALEAGYNIFASSQFDATVASNIFDVAIKGTLPLSKVFSLYGRAGNNSWSGTSSTDGNGCSLCNNSISSNYGLALVGIGGSFRLNKHWDLRLEGSSYLPWSNTYTGNIGVMTFGTQYNF
jgi:hypothetical protein